MNTAIEQITIWRVEKRRVRNAVSGTMTPRRGRRSTALRRRAAGAAGWVDTGIPSSSVEDAEGADNADGADVVAVTWCRAERCRPS